MLSKSDLHQIKDIVQVETRKIVQEETRKIVQDETRKIVQEETRKIVQEETKEIVQAETTKIVRAEITSLEKKLNKRFDRLDRKLDYAVNFLDRDYIKLLHRVERIEEHLNLDPISI